MLAIGTILATIIVFLLMKKLYSRFSTPILFPVLTATIVLVVLLTSFSVSYDTYMSGAKWIDAMLGPAIVSLAYPLYTQRNLIKKNLFSIITSVTVAMISGIISVILLAKLIGVDKEIVASLFSKSITTPVAMKITESLGGIPSLTVVFVILAGLTGAILGPYIFKICKINNPVSKGVSMGSASHAIGVAKLSEYGEQALSMGSVGMTLSAIIGAFICPLFAWFML